MNYSNCFRDLFESIPDYKKILLMILIKNDKGLLPDIGFSERVIHRLFLEKIKRF